MHIPLVILAVVSLLIATRCKKKKVIVALVLLWAFGIASYVHATYRAQLAMAKARSRTTKAVIAVRGRVGGGLGTVQEVELTSQVEIRSLFDVLKLQHSPVFARVSCACRGNPHIQLYDTKGQFATITIHHGKSIRCTLWPSCNVDIREDMIPRLKDYMSSLGVELVD